MTATAADVVQNPSSPAPGVERPSSPILATAPPPAHAAAADEAAQLGAERTLLRTALLGASIGALVCAAIWVGLVALATVGNGTALVPTLFMAAGCGVFAGLFLGGSAGALAGSRALERVQHDRIHATRRATPTA